jgi:hypothetical protein
MKKTILLVSLATAAGVMVGCSTSSKESSDSNSNPAPGTSYNSNPTSGGANSDTTYNGASGSQAGASQSASDQTASSQTASSSSSSGSSGFLGMGGKDVTFDQLPQAAQTTIRNQIGDQQVAKIREETKDGQTAYKIELQKKNWHSLRPDLIVAADGSIIKESHMEKVNEAAGAQAPGSSAAGSSTNSTSSNPQQ